MSYLVARVWSGTSSARPLAVGSGAKQLHDVVGPRRHARGTAPPSADGLHIGAQVYASIGGKPRADGAIGEACRGVALRPDSLMLWMSSVKPVTAAAVLQMHERGLLRLDDRVSRHVPEFAAGGKDAVTVWHLLRLDRGLGVVLDSKRYGPAPGWFGPHCSEHTFGHGGYRCSVGFADPAHALAVAIVFNGMPGDAAHDTRMRATLGALYQDLGLAPA